MQEESNACGVQGVTNASLLALQRDESVATGVLACTKEALEKIHQRTFAAMQAMGGAARAPWDAPRFAMQHRASVLDGVVLLFSKCLQPLKVWHTSVVI